jgi:hypothetical protein
MEDLHKFQDKFQGMMKGDFNERKLKEAVEMRAQVG